MDPTPDAIEREIFIRADAERVWTLISEPGWYINDGAIVPHRIERTGELDVVHDPVHGAFPVRTLRLDRPRYAAFRWEGGDLKGTMAKDEPTTLVEFWIEERAGGVLLCVRESGFAALAVDEAQRRKNHEDNSKGWDIELEAARSFLEAA